MARAAPPAQNHRMVGAGMLSPAGRLVGKVRHEAFAIGAGAAQPAALKP